MDPFKKSSRKRRNRKLQKKSKTCFKEMLIAYQNNDMATMQNAPTYRDMDNSDYSDSDVNTPGPVASTSSLTPSVRSDSSLCPVTEESDCSSSEKCISSAVPETDQSNSSDDMLDSLSLTLSPPGYDDESSDEPFDVDGSLARVIINKLNIGYNVESISVEPSSDETVVTHEISSDYTKVEEPEPRPPPTVPAAPPPPAEEQLRASNNVVDNSLPPPVQSNYIQQIYYQSGDGTFEDIDDILNYRKAPRNESPASTITKAADIVDTIMAQPEEKIDDVKPVEETQSTEDKVTDKSPEKEAAKAEEAISVQPKDNSNIIPEAVVKVPEPIDRVHLYYIGQYCIMVLQHPIQVFINGKVKITSLAGTVEIMGYKMRQGTYEVFAPNYNYHICMKTVENENDYYGLFSKLTTLGLSICDAENIVVPLGDQDAVICLQMLQSRKYNFVEQNFPKATLFSRFRTEDMGLRKCTNILECSLQVTKPPSCLNINPAWDNMFKDLTPEQRQRTLVCGGKGVGKSTFLRYFVNRQLNYGKVLVLDLDPGQSEFTVAGSISATVVDCPLLGPNFTHLREPDVTLNLGIINVMEGLTRYVKGVTQLFSFCCSRIKYHQMPWAINTMGMCNTIGLKLITYILLSIKPTLVLQFNSKNEQNKFEHFLTPEVLRNLVKKYSPSPYFRNVTREVQDFLLIVCDQDDNNRTPKLSPKDNRYLCLLSYFGQLLEIHPWTGFLGLVPFESHIDKICVASDVALDDSALLDILNGKVVALIAAPDNMTMRNLKRSIKLDTDPQVCYGHGLIRGVDKSDGRLFLLSPSSRLQGARGILMSSWTPELQLPVPPGVPVPYRTASNRALLTPVKRRFNPIHLLKSK